MFQAFLGHQLMTTWTGASTTTSQYLLDSLHNHLHLDPLSFLHPHLRANRNQSSQNQLHRHRFLSFLHQDYLDLKGNLHQKVGSPDYHWSWDQAAVHKHRHRLRRNREFNEQLLQLPQDLHEARHHYHLQHHRYIA